MSYTLFRKQIGQEGVAPGELLMSSTDDLVTITLPGYINSHENVLPTDVITLCYGPELNSKQTLNPVFNNGIITLVVIGGGGSINGAVNLGAGDGLLGVSGSNITGKSLIAGASISLVPTGTDITINAVGSGGGTITGIIDVGVGEGHLAAGTSGVNVQVKTLHEGTGIVITEDATTVTIASTTVSTGLTSLANLPGGEGIYASTVGTVAQLKSIAAGAGISVTANANNIIITNTGGGGGNFIYEHTYWLAQNGNDANTGLSINEPKLTMNAVASLLVAGIPTVINIVDSGFYPISSTFVVSCPLLINSPGAIFTWSGAPSGNMFFLNTFSPLIVNAGVIDGGNTLQIFRGFSNIYVTGPSGYCNVINAARIWEDANTLSPNGVAQAIFNVTTEGAIFVFKFAGEQVINALNLGTSTVSSLLIDGSVIVNAAVFSGTLSGVADFIINVANLDPATSITTTGTVNGIYGPTYGGITATPINLAGNPFGAGYQSNIVKRKIIPASGTTIYLDHTMSGAEIILVDNTVIVGLQSYATEPNYPQGFYVDLVQEFSASGCEISGVSLTDIFIRQPTSYPFFTGRGAARVYLAKNATFVGDPNIWVITGEVFNTNLLIQTNVFISQIEGNDATANGNVDSQFATINAALTYVITNFTATPAYGINLVITDDAIYNEKLDFTGTSNIQLIGRSAILSYTSSGGGDNAFTSNSPEQLVSLGGLQVSGGGDAIDYSGPGALILNIDVLGGGNINNTGTGSLYAQTYAIQGNTTNTGGGRFAYTTIQRSGTDGTGVIGTSVLGASQNWTVAGNLSASGLLYPTTDAAAGSVVTTDGAGNLTLQPPAAGGLLFNTVAGTSQLAVAENAYICANAAQTTVTLPAVAAVGATVRVYGQGAAGWKVQANGGQIINLGTTPTSVGGTLTSAANTDLVEVTCLVANTTWQVNFVFSSGLAVA